MSSVWERVEKVYKRPLPSLVFQKSFCVCRCANCEALPTLLHSLSCGCRLCDVCFKHESVNSISVNCSTHKTSTRLIEVKSVELKEDDVMHTKAYCRYKMNGCKQVDIIKSLHRHEELECCFSFVDCPTKCGKKLLLKDIAYHLNFLCEKRIVKCSYCYTEIMLFRMKTHHETCSMFPLQCEYCGISIKRHQMSQHEEICEQKPVSCKFREMGCTFTDKRINISRHETLENHSALFMSTFNELKIIKTDAELQRDSMKEELEVLKTTIEELRDELNTSKQDSEDSLEEAKHIKEWTLEKIETLERQLLQAKDSAPSKEGNVWFSRSSAQYQSLAKFGFKSSTPKSKRNDTKAEPNFLRHKEDRGTQTNDLQDGVIIASEETRVKKIEEEQISNETNDVTNNVTDESNAKCKYRLRRNSPAKESKPISSTTELVYPKSKTRITVLMCIILAILLIISSSYAIIKYANNFSLNYYRSSSHCP